jgi:hypothetical protein
MKTTRTIFALLAYVIAHPVIGQSLEDTATFVQMEPGMGHVEVMAGPVGFTSPHTMVSGFTSSSSSAMMFGQLFPPSQIMRQQEKLKLTNKQINSIKSEMRTFQSGIVDIQWDLNSTQAQLNKELAKNKIDLKNSMTLMEKVLQAESKLKKSHMSLLIKIRNALSEDQIKILRSNPNLPFGPMGMSFGTVGATVVE